MEIETALRACARCGFCRHVCPIYREEGGEALSPRGKLLLWQQSLRKPESLMKADLAPLIYRCTLCGACATACPVGINTRQVWLEAREMVAGLAEAPGSLAQLAAALEAHQNVAGLDNEERTAWWDDLEEEIPTLDRSGKADVLYFVGCVSALYPAANSIAVAVVESLRRAGVRVTTMGADEWCCGYPLVAAGRSGEAAVVKRHNQEVLRSLGVHTLITGCPSCLTAWREWYLPDLEGYPLEVLHVTEFLARLVEEGQIRPVLGPAVVTYHDPCDLGRQQGIFEPPRRLLRTIPGVELREMLHHGAEAMCCGGGGNLQSVAPELSAGIARRRIQEATATGASMLVSACPQCKQVLDQAARSLRVSLRVMDVTEVLWESLVEGGE